MKKIIYRDNSIYRFVSCQPYMNNINQYLIYYDRYTLYHYARRTGGDKYTCSHTKHTFLVDVSNIDMSSRSNFITANWDGFVWQIIDYVAYNKGTITNNDPLSSPLIRYPYEDNGNYKLNTLYTLHEPAEYRHPTMFRMYSELLLRLDVSPSSLKLIFWSGYDNSKSNNETKYYTSPNFSEDIYETT